MFFSSGFLELLVASAAKKRTFRLPDLILILSNLIKIIPDDHHDLKYFMKDRVLKFDNKKMKAMGLYANPYIK